MPKRAVPAARHTRASREFDKILRENGPLARKLRTKIDRGRLARLRAGKRKVELDTAVLVAKITDGRIPAEFWTIPAPAPEPCPSCGRV